ncbi:MAG: YegS/Rv2252/BmrU family lipid kinase [Sphingobacteriales bacterium]|jgi:diacylglycerol kinase (ATP)|nr:YegS/Rv2252/BmrU family lipid kinase [Sphingobacteriales bacterium]
MQRKFLYFINPISGTVNKAPLIRLIEIETAKQNIPYEILPTREDGDYAYLPEKIIQEGTTDVIVCGGDGTVSHVVSWILGLEINVGIIPMGSGNGLALAAGIGKDPSDALQAIFKGKAEAIDGFHINKRFGCMLSGVGFDAQVAREFSLQKKRGFIMYAKQILKNYFHAPTYPFVIHINGSIFRTEALFISIANSNQFGNNVTIAPKASLTDGMLDMVVVKKSNRLVMIFSMLKQIRLGRISMENDYQLSKKGIIYIQANKFIIENEGMAPFHIDGDPVESSTRFEIEVIPGAFRLLHP